MAKRRQRAADRRRGGRAESAIRLPDGVNPADWALEKVRHQNPRIRAFLGCMRMLDEMLETDYHLLHCSPTRLRQIWEQVRELSDVMRTKLVEALDGPSQVEDLEQARRGAVNALSLLDSTLLTELDRFPATPKVGEIFELRKQLCVAMGQLQSFLNEAFGRIVAADPRSAHDVDYYLSRRLPADMEESEWLYETVGDLNAHLQSLDEDRARLLQVVSIYLDEDGELPPRETWSEVSVFLVGLYNDLPVRLKEILCLHGVRFEEMNSLNRYAIEIPTKCLKVFEIYDLSRELFENFDQSSDAGDVEVRKRCRASVARRLGRLLADLDRTLRDLIAFVPLWQHNIEGRRSLALKKNHRNGEPADVKPSASSAGDEPPEPETDQVDTEAPTASAASA